MFARVELAVSDLEVSRCLYAVVLGALGHPPGVGDPGVGGVAWGDFVLARATSQAPVTRGLHVAFAASSRRVVDAFWLAGVRAGFRDDGAPGLRDRYVADYYGAFLLDPDGNSVEAVHHAGVRRDGVIDHLWIRVGDLAAAHGWYRARSVVAGWRTRVVDETRVQVDPVAGGGTFALVCDERPLTRNAHFALCATEPATAGVERDPDGNRVALLARDAAR